MRMVLETPSDRAVADTFSYLRRRLVRAGLTRQEAEALLAGCAVERDFTERQGKQLQALMPEVQRYLRGQR